MDDPCFPIDQLEMVILVYAFHDFTRPVDWLKNAKKYMNKDASLVIIDRDPEKTGGDDSHFLTGQLS